MTLLLIDFALVVAYLVLCLGFHRYAAPFNLDVEGNIPAWWSSVQLSGAGLALGLVGFKNVRISASARSVLCLAMILVAMSIDETASLHEYAGRLLDHVLGDRSHSVFRRTGLWFAVIGIPFTLIFGLLIVRMCRFLEDVPRTTFRLGLGMTLLLSGAVVVEATSNFFGRGDFYLAEVAMEEGLEMIGGSALMWAAVIFLLQHRTTRGLVEIVRPLTKKPVD